MDISLVLTFLVLGAAVGFAAGLLGIGGGMLLVPFLTLLLTYKGFSPTLIVHMAIATSLATIMFTSISSVRAHHKRGAVIWPIVMRLTPGILIGSWIGPWLAKQMNPTMLATFFGLFLVVSATQMILDKKPSPTRNLPEAGGMFAAGGAIGTISGIVGAGGGFISVPFMAWCNVKIHNAVATSAALGFPIALAGTLSNIYYGMDMPNLPAGSLGFVYLPALLVISIASVFTAPLGARTAHSMPVKTLKRVFAVMLYMLAVYMLYKAYNLGTAIS